MKLSDKAKAFLNRKPTLIGRVAGHAFYEHPEHGDEAPLVMIDPEGRVSLSDWYDVPTADEITGPINISSGPDWSLRNGRA